MRKPLKFAVLGGIVAISFTVIGLGALLVLSGGQPVSYVQKILIRLSMSGREAELEKSVSSDTTPVRFTVQAGDTPRIIAQNLLQNGLIGETELFVDYVQLEDLDRKLQAGTYFLNPALSMRQIAEALADPANTQFSFRLLEGLRLEEVIEQIDQDPRFGFAGDDFSGVAGPGATIDSTFSNALGLPAGASLNGFLYPDTYRLPADVTPIMLRDILIQTFIDKVGPQIPLDVSAQGLTMFEVVTLASIVQREAVHDDERPMIASVYRNRLASGWRLEADPTVQYGLGFKDGTWWPRITAADYSTVNSPYNTYLYPGLPPGPINSPGLASIRAVVYPAQSPYYFFRADCRSDGYHDFAITFAEHVANGC